MIATRKSSFLPTRKGGGGKEEREHKRTFLRTFAEGRRTAAGSVCTPLFLPLSLAPSHLSGIRTLFAPFFFLSPSLFFFKIEACVQFKGREYCELCYVLRIIKAGDGFLHLVQRQCFLSSGRTERLFLLFLSPASRGRPILF